MKPIRIALKDLQILFKDRGSLFMLFLLPLLFIVVFSGALGAIGSGGKDTRIALVVVDRDGGKSAQTLIEKLDRAGSVRVERQEETRAMTRLNLSDIPRVLVIPETFRRVAHTLKSNSRDFGATVLSEVYRDLEMMARPAHWMGRPRNWRRLRPSMLRSKPPWKPCARSRGGRHAGPTGSHLDRG